VLDESDTHWLFKATFVDLENGVTIPRLFKQRKPRSAKGDFDLDRFEDMEFQMGQSKALRNVIKDALPAWLITKCIDVAKDREEKKVAKAPDVEKKEIVKRAEAVGLQPERLLRKMGKRIKDYTAADIVTVKALLTTVEEGHAPLNIIFPDKAAAPKPAATEANVDEFDGGVEPDADFDEPEVTAEPAVPQGPSELYTKFARDIVDATKALSDDGLHQIGQSIKEAQQAGRIDDVEVDELRDLWSKAVDTVAERARAGA
jgi:hypothetical protein